MSTILPRRAGFVCHACRRFSTVQNHRQRFISQATNASKQEAPPKSRTQVSWPPRRRDAPTVPVPPAAKTTSLNGNLPADGDDVASGLPLKTFDPSERLDSFRKTVAYIHSHNAAADQVDVLEALMEMFSFANTLVHGVSRIPHETAQERRKGGGDALLQDLTEDKAGDSSSEAMLVPDKQMSLAFREEAAKKVSELAYNLLRDPKVFISEQALQVYVRIMCLLGKPEYLPEIFDMYAKKMIPDPKSSPVTYSAPWPRMPKYAIPHNLAEAALEAAILKKNLGLALAIIDTTVGAPAFRTNKILRRAGVPGLLVGGMPLVAYAGADWVAHWQNTMDVELSKYTAIAGALAYIGTLSTIGFVAVTTWNDQMQRVVWRPGTALSSRWIREEERAFFDRLALAWGFQERYRWGEEHGQDWQTLRDECGMRDMILDKTELMEGMQ